MSTRYDVKAQQLKEIQEELKSRGYSLEDIKEEIEADFRNFRYKDHSMNKATFKRLEEFYGKDIEAEEIEYIEGKGERKQIQLEKNAKLAELIGIILGDGYLQKTSKKEGNRTVTANRVVITLSENEQSLVDLTSELMKNCLGKNPTVTTLKDQPTVQLIVHSKEIVEELENSGLESGNKVENQVSVPNWIKQKNEFERKCLKGLVDTDGCIYQQSGDGRTIIQFKNHSENLLKDFQEMCHDLDINSSNGGEHISQVASKPEVKKFIRKIQPLKAKNISF